MKIGDIFVVKYPFVRCEVDIYHPDDDGGVTHQALKSWRPGCECETNDYGGADWSCDKEGEMILEVISIHKPGKYPERVFYTRKWKNPAGEIFGKPGLKITTSQNFKQLAKGYRHDYVPAED